MLNVHARYLGAAATVFAAAAHAHATTPRFLWSGEIPVAVQSNQAFVNIRGWVGGMSATGAFVWRNGSLQTVPAPSGRAWLGVSGINDFGDLAGTVRPLAGGANQAIAWVNNQFVSGPSGPSWMANSAIGVNNRRQVGVFIVPYSAPDCGNGSTQWFGRAGVSNGNLWRTAAAWSSQCTIACTQLVSYGYSLNNAGEILAVGAGTVLSGGRCSPVNNYYVSFANGTSSAAIPNVIYSAPPVINDLGEVVSQAVWNDPAGSVAGIQRWSGGVVQRLYTYGPYRANVALPSKPIRANNLGQVIASDVGSPTGYFDNGVWHDFRTLVTLPPGVTIDTLLDINDVGQVVASGRIGNLPRLLLFEPAPQCAADFNFDSVVNDADFIIFADAYQRVECPVAPQPCPADLNFDGIVDDQDFLLFTLAYNRVTC